MKLSKIIDKVMEVPTLSRSMAVIYIGDADDKGKVKVSYDVAGKTVTRRYASLDIDTDISEMEGGTLYLNKEKYIHSASNRYINFYNTRDEYGRVTLNKELLSRK